MRARRIGVAEAAIAHQGVPAAPAAARVAAAVPVRAVAAVAQPAVAAVVTVAVRAEAVAVAMEAVEVGDVAMVRAAVATTIPAGAPAARAPRTARASDRAIATLQFLLPAANVILIARGIYAAIEIGIEREMAIVTGIEIAIGTSTGVVPALIEIATTGAEENMNVAVYFIGRACTSLRIMVTTNTALTRTSKVIRTAYSQARAMPNVARVSIPSVRISTSMAR